jgi:hypothetical protein
MKLLPILLLTLVLSLGVACSSEPAVPPTATPDVPTYSEDEAMGLVQGMLRSHPDLLCRNYVGGRHNWYAKWRTPSEGKSYWVVGAEWPTDRARDTRVYGFRASWKLYEGTNAIKANSHC